MSKRTYDEVSVVAKLSKKRAITIDRGQKIIKVDFESADVVGNKSWGKIDYLCHYCGYIWLKATHKSFVAGSKTKVVSTNTEVEDKPKKIKSLGGKKSKKLKML